MATQIWVNIGSGNGLLQLGTKPLPKPILTSHKRYSVTFTREQFHKFENYIFKIFTITPRGQWVNMTMIKPPCFAAMRKNSYIREPDWYCSCRAAVHMRRFVQNRHNSMAYIRELVLRGSSSQASKGWLYSSGSLTHWGQNKIAAIFQLTFSNAFSWMKIFEFRLIFHLSLFPGIQLTIFQLWFR